MAGLLVAGGGSCGGPAVSGGGGSANGGSSPVFVGGPCVATPTQDAIEVFGRNSDGHIYRRAYDGMNWGSWDSLVGLDGDMIDARSDLDCSATSTGVHIVASGLNPTGALLHAFGFGTSYNPFVRELSQFAFKPSPAIAVESDDHLFLGSAICPVRD